MSAYLKMTEADWLARAGRAGSSRASRLDPYEHEVVNMLTSYPFLSCPAIHDRLKEAHPDFPEVTERTVFNFVHKIRDAHDIPAVKASSRQFAMVPPTEPGEQAQVDFGESMMDNSRGGKTRVHFFAMTSTYSRAKFVYLQSYPFTAETAVYAHDLAFRYFGGTFRRVLYDQDRCFLVDENFGEYKCTEAFRSYVVSAGYEAVFAHARDPQTKGVVERTVGYVKNNFLAGRKYVNDLQLNEECLGWLSRTGNMKPHSVTRVAPFVRLEEERPFLSHYDVAVEEPSTHVRPYSVRKDNVVVYRGNYYCMPMGTYDTCRRVLLSKDEESGQLEFYTCGDFSLICRHDEVVGRKGEYRPLDTQPRQDPYRSKAAIAAECRLYDVIYPYLDWGPFSKDWERIKKAVLNGRPRYYRSALDRLTRAIKEFGGPDVESAVTGILEYDLKGINEILDFLDDCETPGEPEPPYRLPDGMSEADMTPERSSIDTYRHIFEEEDGLPD